MHPTEKIYIAGHRGMVGSAILRNLQAKGYNNIVYREFSELDLLRQEKVEAFFNEERPEYVIDAAAKVGGIVANNIYRAQFIYENLVIQNNIIHSAYQYGVKKLLFLGSSCIYPKNAPQPMKENTLLTGVLEPTNEPYAIAKIAGIKMCENYYRQYGCNFISVMPTNLYGPNDNYDLEKSHVLPAMIRKMHLGKLLVNGDWRSIKEDFTKRPFGIVDTAIGIGTIERLSETDIIGILERFGIQLTNINDESARSKNQLLDRPAKITLWGSGQVFREFMYVEDLADACVYLMQQVDANILYDKLGQTHINIGTGIDINIRELAELIRNIVGFTGSIAWDRSKPDGTPKKQLDVTLLTSLNWKASTQLRSGIEKVYKAYRE